MSRMVAAMAVVLLSMGCGSEEQEAVQGAAGTAANRAGETVDGVGETARGASDYTASTKAETDAILAANTITGLAGCTHCDFKTSETCAPAIQIADGAVYKLDGVDYESDVFQKKMKGNKIRIEGEVQRVDGELRVEVASFELP